MSRRGRPRGGDRNQAVGALVDRLVGELVVDDVVQRHAAVGMHRGVDVLARAERGDDDRRHPFHRQRDVLFEACVRLVDDLVDREWRRRAVGVVAIVRRERLGNLVQPFVELADRPRVEGWKRSDDPACTARSPAPDAK